NAAAPLTRLHVPRASFGAAPESGILGRWAAPVHPTFVGSRPGSGGARPAARAPAWPTLAGLCSSRWCRLARPALGSQPSQDRFGEPRRDREADAAVSPALGGGHGIDADRVAASLHQRAR